jgi:hypothetical protein
MIIILLSRNQLPIPIDLNDFVNRITIPNTWTPPTKKYQFSEENSTSLDSFENKVNIDDLIQMNFLYSISVLRSITYHIPLPDRQFVMLHARTVQSAVASTSVICGSGQFIEYIISLISPENTCLRSYMNSLTHYLIEFSPIPEKKKLDLSEDIYTEWRHFQIF